eukprot:3859141-Karenia_brevis.AAC.1
MEFCSRRAPRSKPNWWAACWSLVIEIDSHSYIQGFASGDGCNCLIDTIRQQLGAQCDVAAVRGALERKLPDIMP